MSDIPVGPKFATFATFDRRDFLSRAGLGLGAGLGLSACGTARAAAPAVPATTAAAKPAALTDWAAVRGEFSLSPAYVHLALMLLTSHPRPVRDAIERHRRGLDENPVDYFEERFMRIEGQIRKTAANYLGGSAEDIALTDSTTMALATMYGGLPLRPGQEILTTVHDHYSTYEALRQRTLRDGARVRKIALYDDPDQASVDQIVGRLVREIGATTRVLALTWVHSSTGVKLPIREIAQAVATINGRRDVSDQVLLCVDGVHGLGVESERPLDLGCDFFAAGCHKWMFGPRGTGVLWGRASAWKGLIGLIPPFEEAPYVAWMKGETPAGPPGPMATPGGFHSFEHRWALGEAFEFHQRIGRARITARIHELATQCKRGLTRLPHVKVHTPISPRLSAALVCFEVRGKSAEEVVKHLHARKIIASVTPYATKYARLSPGILNTPEEIDRVVGEIRGLG